MATTVLTDEQFIGTTSREQRAWMLAILTRYGHHTAFCERTRAAFAGSGREGCECGLLHYERLLGGEG